MGMTNFQTYSRVHRSKMPPMAATPRTDLVSLTPQCLASHRRLVQRGQFRAHLLQNRRRQRGVALRLRDFLPGRVHPAQIFVDRMAPLQVLRMHGHVKPGETHNWITFLAWCVRQRTRKSSLILDSIAKAASLMLFVDGFTNSPAALRIRAIDNPDFSPQRSST